MDSNMAGFMYNASTLETMYHHHEVKKDDGFIDLGLSLKTLHPRQAVNPVENTVSESMHMESMIVAEELQSLLEWQYLHPVNLNGSNTGCSRTNPVDCGGEDLEAVQSKERRCYSYVKVNMDGVVVGRKICPGDHSGYAALSLHLEDMFGRHSGCGLWLFTEVSEFLLFYKDKHEHWRPVGDVPWKEFVDTVKRLRIMQKNRLST